MSISFTNNTQKERKTDCQMKTGDYLRKKRAVEARKRAYQFRLSGTRLMARKMHCALQQISTNSPKISKAGKNSLSGICQKQNIYAPSLEDCEESSLLRRNSDSRCAILAFPALEPDGNWRILALAVQCLNLINLASGGNMDGLQLIFPPPLNKLKIHQYNGQRGPLPDYAYSVKSFTGRSVTGSNAHRQCQNKICNKASKLNELSGNSFPESSMTCSNSSGLFPDHSAAVNSSDMFMSNSKADKSVKKNSRKRARKKGRQSKKQSSNCGSTEPEVLADEYVRVSLTSEICGSNHVDNEDRLMSYTTGPELSSSDDSFMKFKNDSERHEMDDSINLTEAPKGCTSYIDVVEMSETTTPIVHKLAGDSAICNSKYQLQNREPFFFAVIDGKAREMQHVQLYSSNDMYSKHSSNVEDSLLLDSILVGPNNDGSTNAGDIEQQFNKSSCRLSLSEPPNLNSGDESILGQNLLNGVGNNWEQNDGIRPGGQNSISIDKRVKQKRTVSRSVSVNKFGGAGLLHGRTGKENSLSVWQKVQKNDAEGCHGDLKKENMNLSQCYSTLESSPSVNRNCNFKGVNIQSTTEDNKHLKKTVGRKSKGRMDPVSRKGYSDYSRKGSHFNRSILNDNAKLSVQQNGMSSISSQESNQGGLSSISGSHPHINSARVELQTDRVEPITSESTHIAHIHLEKSDPPQSSCHNILPTKNQNIESQDSSLSIPCDCIDQSSMSEEQSPMSSHLLGDEVGQIKKEVFSGDYNVQNHNSGSTLWKWIPVGKKDAELAVSKSDSSSLEYSDELPIKDFTLESNVESKIGESDCMGQIYSIFSCLQEDENQKLGSQIACTPTENRDKHVVADNLKYESDNQDALEKYSYRIAQSLNDVSRAQLACEAVQMATGSPIAEFEKLLQFCSPIICRSTNSPSCWTCSWDHADGVPLCRHEIPDLSLGCLWQWYEKHGSYGLEIRALDYENSKRLGVGHFPFRAYFVPSLSAVQLFKNHKSHCEHSRKLKVSEACEISDMTEHSSTATQHPVSSVLFPQRCNWDASIQKPTNQMHSSEVSSASGKEKASGSSINLTCSGDLEILFEYFESEQPQQRSPLYEKIQELVRGNISAESKVYGDPTKLNSVKLQDIHPRSWYSVAWYPIYRIPHGNFRAAFLTYHSVGHLVHRRTKTDSPTLDSCIVSPAVGLQSYNALGECWFQLSHSALMAEMLGLNPSGLLKERLQTLEQTASLMARAVVNKGNLICTNRHPDYEFFLSRRR